MDVNPFAVGTKAEKKLPPQPNGRGWQRSSFEQSLPTPTRAAQPPRLPGLPKPPAVQEEVASGGARQRRQTPGKSLEGRYRQWARSFRRMPKEGSALLLPMPPIR